MPPVNDNVVDAIAITSGTIVGTNVGATPESAYESAWWGFDIPSVWYKWTNTEPDNVDVTIQNLTGDAGFSPEGPEIDVWLYNSGSPTSFEDLDTWPTGIWFTLIGPTGDLITTPYQTVTKTIQPGQTLFLNVSNYAYAQIYQGEFSFDFFTVLKSDGPSNDDLANAIVVTPGIVCGTTVGADNEQAEKDHWFSGDSIATVWYKWTNSTGAEQTVGVTKESLTSNFPEWRPGNRPRLNINFYLSPITNATDFNDIYLDEIDYVATWHSFSLGIVPIGYTVYMQCYNDWWELGFYGTFCFVWDATNFAPLFRAVSMFWRQGV